MAGGKIRGITIELDGDTTKLEQALRKVNKETKALDKEMKYVNNALKLKPTSVELWGQKQKLLTMEIEKTKKKLDALKAAKAKADADPSVDKESEEYRRLQREIVETEAKLKSLNGELRKVGNTKLKALSEQFKAIGDKMQEMGKTMTQKVTMPLAAVGAVSVKKFAEVDKTMQLVNSTMGNSAQQASLLDKAMKEAAANSTYGMSDAATATLNFARAGLTAEQAAATLAPAMNLAAGEGGNLDTVSAGLVATINGFGDSFDNAATYADIFANACNNSALDIDSMAQSMSIAAPVFAAAGYSVQDAALYMGVMANKGIDASTAANALKTGMARLASPSKEAATWMDKLGISLTDSNGNMKDTVTLQRELHDSFAGLSESEQIAAASAIFGKNQMSNWLALINTAPGEVQNLNASLREMGTTQRMADAMMSGFGGSIEKLKSSLDVAATSFGQALAPALSKVIGAIQKLLDWFNNLTPATQQVIATIALIVAAIGPALLIVGKIVSGIGMVISAVNTVIGVIGAIVPVVTTVIGIIGAAGAAFLGVAAVIGVVAVMIYKHWDEIKAKAQELWDAIKAKFEGIKQSISDAWNSVKTTAVTLWNQIKTAVMTPINALKAQLSAAWNAITSHVRTAWNTIKTAIVTPIQTAVNLVRSGINKIKSIINGAKLKLPKIKLPHFKVSGKLSLVPPSVPRISVSWYKEGGIFDSPTVFTGGVGVGEAGPEGVIPLDKFWDKMDRIAEAATDATRGVTINVYASPGMDVNALAAAVERRLVTLQKQKEAAWT